MNKTILLFTDWYEPAYKAGGPVQSCRKIVESFSNEFRFYIVTSDRDLGDKEPFRNIVFNRWHTLNPDVQICYTSPGWLSLNNIQALIRKIEPSIVYLNSMFSSNFTLKPLWAMKKMDYKGRIILAPRGMLMLSALSEKKWKKRIFLRLLSFTDFSKRIIFHATDEQERLGIKKYIGNKANVVVASNIPNVPNHRPARQKQPGKLDIVYISRIHPIKNLLYALNVLKQVKRGPIIKFDIYGLADDDNYFKKCFEAARQLEGRVTIHFMGPVEHDTIFNVLGNYHLFFLPTHGENFGHAIFEALSSGCPVLISNTTPWKDIEKSGAGWAMPLHENVRFVECIEKMCDLDENEFEIMSKNAIAYATAYLSNANYRDRYLELFS